MSQRETPNTGRYEFRVWGRHRQARKLLAALADSTTHEQVDDCYLIVDDANWNAKIRGGSIKIKQLVTERKGFEQWVSERYRTTAATPSPFDDLLEEIGLDKLLAASPVDLERIVKRTSKSQGVHASTVSKDRRRYTVGEIRAESTKLYIHESGEILHTLVIEGNDLDELKSLRRQLGINNDDNVAVHNAIADELGL